MTRESFIKALIHCFRPVPLFIGALFSSPSVLTQAMRSVPAFLGIDAFWSLMLSSAVGALQGLLSGVVLPRVGAKLPGNRLSFLVATGLFTNCVFPAAVIVCLDVYCFGSWSAFWAPCRNNPEQFRRKVAMSVLHEKSWQLFSPADVCGSYRGRQTTVSKCVQVALLRLQDLWLPKIITAGVALPAGRLVMRAHYKDSTDIASAIAVHISYALIAAGHLPLVMPLLWLGVWGITLLAVVSWYKECLHVGLKEQDMTAIVALPQVLSALVHAASASGLGKQRWFFCRWVAPLCLQRLWRSSRMTNISEIGGA